MLVLVHLRKDRTLAEIAVGFGDSTETACRCVTETVALSMRVGFHGLCM
ncbi:transposase family protein [Streptomyces sp. NPDC050625]